MSLFFRRQVSLVIKEKKTTSCQGSELSSTLAHLSYGPVAGNFRNMPCVKACPFIIVPLLPFRSSQQSAFGVFVQHMKGSVSKAWILTSMSISQIEI